VWRELSLPGMLKTLVDDIIVDLVGCWMLFNTWYCGFVKFSFYEPYTMFVISVLDTWFRLIFFVK